MSDPRQQGIRPASSSQELGPRDLSEAELQHFNSIPWAKSILQQSLHHHKKPQHGGQEDTQTSEGSGDYVAIHMTARTVKGYTDEDGFFAGTLGTNETIPFLITLCRRDLHSVPKSTLPKEPPLIDPKSKKSFSPSRPPDTITLVSLSTPGISGHPETAHGGVIATLFDEAMSHAIEAFRSPNLMINTTTTSPPGSSTGPRERDSIYTAQLNVRYKKPVYAPGLLVIRSWCVARDGRKYWAIAHAVQEEQGGDGGHLEWAKRKTVRAEASSLWVITRNEKL